MRTEDCFTQFDAAFNTLASELAWPGAPTLEPRPASEGGPQALMVRPPVDHSADELEPAVALAEAEQAKAEVIAAAESTEEGRSSEPSAHSAQFEEAFDKLDSQLAQSGTSRSSGDDTPRVAAATREDLPPVFEVDAAWFGDQPAPDTPVTPTLKSAFAPAEIRRDESAMAPAPLEHVRGGPARVVPFEPVIPNDRPEPALTGGWTPLATLLRLLENLSQTHARLAASDRPAEGISREAMAGLFAHARQVCHDLDLHTAGVRVDFALEALERSGLDSLSVEIEELLRHIRHDLQFCFVCSTPRSRSKSRRASLRKRLAAR